MWWVRAPTGSSGMQPVIEVRQAAEERGWTVFEDRCVRLAINKGDASGRIVNLLERCSASRLYGDMHRGPLAVLYEAPVWVRTSPGTEIDSKRLIPIGRFCKYKAFSMSLKDNRAADWVQRFEAWLAVATCDGPRDPRVLPLHIFKMRRAASLDLELDSAADRKRFRQMHLRGGDLEDDGRRRWRAAEPGARHGRDPQFVGNQELPLGFHWDVRRSTGAKLETPLSIWRVGRGGHINVYADGHVRRGTGCQLIWDQSRSRSADEADRLGTRL